MLGFNGLVHVYDAVFREQSELTVCQVIREVVNVDQEQDRSVAIVQQPVNPTTR